MIVSKEEAYYSQELFDMSDDAIANCRDSWYDQLEKLEEVPNMNYAVFLVEGNGYLATQLIACFIEEVEAIDYCMLFPRTHELVDKLTVLCIKDELDVPF